MPAPLARVEFVYNGVTGFLYRPRFTAHPDKDPIIAALVKHCDLVQVEQWPPLVKRNGAHFGETKQAKLNTDRGTTVSISVGGYRIPVNDR